MSSDSKQPMRVVCGKCDHEWIALYTPMPMEQVGKLLKAIQCPMCAAGAADIFMAKGRK